MPRKAAPGSLSPAQFRAFVDLLNARDRDYSTGSSSWNTYEMWRTLEQHVGRNVSVLEIRLRVLPSFAARKRLCDQRFLRLAAGTGRLVYALDNHSVLKLARNAKGIAQNQVEADYGLHDMYGDILTHVSEADEDGHWLVAERACRLTKRRFRELLGIDFVRMGYHLCGLDIPGLAAPELADHPFVSRLQGLIGDFDLTPGDLRRISSYGEVCRDGKPQVVLTDYGVTREIFRIHYSRQRQAFQRRFRTI